MNQVHFTGQAESAKKTILDIYELSKRILGTTIEVLSAKRGATVVFYLLKSQRTLRLCGEKQFFNLGILAHFRQFKFSVVRF